MFTVLGMVQITLKDYQMSMLRTNHLHKPNLVDSYINRLKPSMDSH